MQCISLDPAQRPLAQELLERLTKTRPCLRSD